MKLNLLILILLSSLYASGQKIHFSDINLETALSIAKDKNKNVFIDSYASYCVPCKVMEIEFKNPELARFFNDNFVNVRVNMEHPKAKDYELKYQIVFLPTMIFVTPEGRVLTKLDRLVPASELLNIGKLFSNQTTSAPAPAVVHTPPPSQPQIKPKAKPATVATKKAVASNSIDSKNTTPTRTKPVSKEAVTISPDESEGKILYVMGQDTDNLPPEILKQEAYFRMQLMDGSHNEAAAKYLKSQPDWNTEENIKFIHDFLQDARSQEFEFLIANREKFEKIVGKKHISQTVNILVNKELERGYPRPDLDRAITLYEYAQKEDAASQAMIYQLNNLFNENKRESFMKLAGSINITELGDADLIYKYSSELSKEANSSRNLRKCYQLAKEAVALEPSVAIYHYNQAQIALLLKDKKSAKKALAKAKKLVGDNSDGKEKIKQLNKMIDLL